MELTAKDPDPYFFGSYNWYYTGGVLETASIVDEDFLFYVSGEKLNVFSKWSGFVFFIFANSIIFLFAFFTDSAALIANKNHRLQLEHLDSTNQIICDTIYEIIKSHDNYFVAARQKHHFAVFCLQDNLAQHDFQCERNIPFMSGAFNQHHFYTIDANRVIQRHDLRADRESGRMHLKLPKNHNHWCQLKSYNNQLIYADSDQIKLYDTRLFAKKSSLCMRMAIDSVAEKCEEITSICSDADENNFYVATTHNLFAFDIRYGMESCNQLTRYTHQMKTPPLMLDASGGGATGYAPNERLITMAGTYADDISIVQHTKAVNEKIRSHNIPQTPLGLTDVAHQLRENGLHSQADNLTSNKNRFVNIGTRLVRIDSNLFLLSEKSSGEIFYQEITSETERLQERVEFDNKLYRNLDFGAGNQKDVDENEDDEDDNSDVDANVDRPWDAVGSPATAAPQVTTVTNFDSLKRILNFKLNGPELGGEEVPDIENPRPKKWQQSIEQLQSYKDMLSADLLGIWLDQSAPPKEDQPDKTEFVHGWVNRSAGENVYDDDQHSDF